MKNVSTLSVQTKLLKMYVSECLNALALVDSPAQVITPQDYTKEKFEDWGEWR